MGKRDPEDSVAWSLADSPVKPHSQLQFWQLSSVDGASRECAGEFTVTRLLLVIGAVLVVCVLVLEASLVVVVVLVVVEVVVVVVVTVQYIQITCSKILHDMNWAQNNWHALQTLQWSTQFFLYWIFFTKIFYKVFCNNATELAYLVLIFQ